MKSSPIIPHQILERRGRLILKKLQRTGSIIKRLQSPAGEVSENYGLFNTNISFDIPKETVEEKLIQAFLSRGWITTTTAGLIISDAGKAWLKRQNDIKEQTQNQFSNSSKSTMSDIQATALANDMTSPLAWLRKRKDKSGTPLLDAAQYEAGERLRRDYTFANLTQRTTANWSITSTANNKSCRASTSNIGHDLQDDILTARKKVKNALDYIGPELSGVLISICCHSQGLEEIEKTNSWPQRSGKIVLRIALSKLARYYGLAS